MIYTKTMVERHRGYTQTVLVFVIPEPATGRKREIRGFHCYRMVHVFDKNTSRRFEKLRSEFLLISEKQNFSI